MKIYDTIQRAFDSAGLNAQSGLVKNIKDTIQKALSAAGLAEPMASPPQNGVILEGVAREIFPPGSGQAADTPAQGRFLKRSYTNQAGTRAYKLYIPASYSQSSSLQVPLIVMLHGCKQSPDDFAAGTRMNALAERHGFLVAYPAQAANANGSKCWNWFRAEDQQRDRGEPSLLAGIAREISSEYRIDARRVFVAGLSAGAAMAVVLGATYPDYFAGVGAHSGLPYGAAHDMPSAFSAMQNGKGYASMAKVRHSVPTIVFHGDCDATVNLKNGIAIVEQAVLPHTGRAHEEITDKGRRVSRTIYRDNADHPSVEQWVVHGAGHAWSGGSPQGSFTDAGGPDASAEMIRFFYAQRPAGAA